MTRTYPDNSEATGPTHKKDWTGQTYDEMALADANGGRAQYDANLIQHLNPRVSLNISGTIGSERHGARCLTGFTLTSNGSCERCGAGPQDACLSSDSGTAGSTLKSS